jgi:hypothetical protein
MSKAIGLPSLFLAITLTANAQTAMKSVVRAVSKPAAASMKRAMVALEAATDKDHAMKGALQTALNIATGLRTLPFDVNLWQAQNIWNDLFRRNNNHYWTPEWKLAFKKLGEALYISVDELVIDEGVTVF